MVVVSGRRGSVESESSILSSETTTTNASETSKNRHRHRHRRRSSRLSVSSTATANSTKHARPTTAPPRPTALDKFIDNRWGSESGLGSSYYGSRAASRRSSRGSSMASMSERSYASSRPQTAYSRMSGRSQQLGTNRPRTAFGTTISQWGPRPDDRFREPRGTMTVDYNKPISLDELGDVGDVIKDEVSKTGRLPNGKPPAVDMNPDTESLVAPGKRRDALHAQLDAQDRAKEVRAEMSRRAKSVQAMRQSTRYPQGFLSDASATQKARRGKGDAFQDKHSVYASRARAILERRENSKAHGDEARRSRLAKAQNATIGEYITDKNIPAPDKRRPKGSGTTRDNGNLFENMLLPAPVPINAEARKTAIRNQDSNGRDYDVITNVRTKHYPPSISEKKDSRKLHPSLLV